MKTETSLAIITGATSGIGKSFAIKLAEKGYNLILTGRREKELTKVCENISQSCGVRIETIVGDLSEVKIREKIRNKITSSGNIDFLINNAGFGIDHAFHRIGLTDINSMLATHDQAAIEFIHAVLPGMIKRQKGNIINVCSLGIFIPGFTRSLYLATKSFLHYFTKALSMEVYPYGIKLQSLCPGMTTSNFHQNSGTLNSSKKKLKFMSPDKVVSKSLKSLKKNCIICIPGGLNKILFILAKSLPLRMLRWLSRFRIEEPHEIAFN